MLLECAGVPEIPTDLILSAALGRNPVFEPSVLVTCPDLLLVCVVEEAAVSSVPC